MPEDQVLKTILITDHNIFRFSADAGVGTAPRGRFTIDPTKTPKQVDSTALAGPHKGQVAYGIYEILDATNKRACWGMPGAPRPTDFTSTPGTGRTDQQGTGSRVPINERIGQASRIAGLCYASHIGKRNLGRQSRRAGLEKFEGQYRY